MTREKAIAFGKKWLQINEYWKGNSTYSFFQIAIKALEQELVLDKINYEISHLPFRPYEGRETLDRRDVLQILDKYKTKTEVEDGSN